MTGYPKTPGRAFWKFCGQMAGSLGVFFLVLTIFQSTSPSGLWWQQFVRESFTTDADLAPVMQFFYGEPLDSLSDEAAVSVGAELYPVREVMAAPVTGRVLLGVEDASSFQQLTERFQQGIWVAAAPEEKIRAAYSGTVTDIAEDDGGYTVEISHANGLVTIYGCCARCYVQLNEPVEKGQAIGQTRLQDTEGNFYFAARYLGEPVDPLELLQEKIDATTS